MLTFVSKAARLCAVSSYLLRCCSVPLVPIHCAANTQSCCKTVSVPSVPIHCAADTQSCKTASVPPVPICSAADTQSCCKTVSVPSVPIRYTADTQSCKTVSVPSVPIHNAADIQSAVRLFLCHQLQFAIMQISKAAVQLCSIICIRPKHSHS